MGTTGKKFVVALSALVVLLGIGWWLLQAPYETSVSQAPGTSSSTLQRSPELALPPINPNEPTLAPALLREISVSLQLVSDSLASGSDPQPALEMLNILDARLAGLSSPTRVSALRQALTEDRQRIAQARPADINAMQTVLKRMQGEVSSLPNLFVPHSGSVAPAPSNSAAPAPAGSDSVWGRIMSALGERIGEVVKVRRVEDRQSSFRTPEQGRLLTEQLRFRIESASAALEMRNAQRFSTELGHAQAILAQAFDADHPAVVAFRESLVSLQRQSQGLRPPALEASLNALQRLNSGAAL